MFFSYLVFMLSIFIPIRLHLDFEDVAHGGAALRLDVAGGCQQQPKREKKKRENELSCMHDWHCWIKAASQAEVRMRLVHHPTPPLSQDTPSQSRKRPSRVEMALFRRYTAKRAQCSRKMSRECKPLRYASRIVSLNNAFCSWLTFLHSESCSARRMQRRPGSMTALLLSSYAS